MKVKVLGCHGGGGKKRGLTSFLVNGHTTFDAGNIVGGLEINEQYKIENVVISHTHLDHIRDLPLLADNFIDLEGRSINVYSHEFVISSFKNYFFNNVIFPDFSRIPKNRPIINYIEIEDEKPFKIKELNILPVKVNHTVPNMGFIVDDGKAGFAFIPDTFSTEKIYKRINENPLIKFVIIEVSFPNENEKIAILSKHLTPSLLEKELKKIRDDLKVYLFHLKPSYEEKIKKEIERINTDKEIEILEDGVEISL